MNLINFVPQNRLMTGKNMSKLGFSDILKSGINTSTGKIKEDRSDLQKFITETLKKQAEVLKLKDISENQLKIVIKL